MTPRKPVHYTQNSVYIDSLPSKNHREGKTAWRKQIYKQEIENEEKKNNSNAFFLGGLVGIFCII